jgi:phage shock protein E
MWSCAAGALCGCGAPESAADNSPAGQQINLSMDGAVLLDVRSPEEYAGGHLQGAVNIPHDRIAEKISAVVQDKSTPVILYCRSGRRADTALKTMRAMGYEQVQNFGGLDDAQERLGLPVEKD